MYMSSSHQSSKQFYFTIAVFGGIILAAPVLMSWNLDNERLIGVKLFMGKSEMKYAMGINWSLGIKMFFECILETIFMAYTNRVSFFVLKKKWIVLIMLMVPNFIYSYYIVPFNDLQLFMFLLNFRLIPVLYYSSTQLYRNSPELQLNPTLFLMLTVTLYTSRILSFYAIFVYTDEMYHVWFSTGSIFFQVCGLFIMINLGFSWFRQLKTFSNMNYNRDLYVLSNIFITYIGILTVGHTLLATIYESPFFQYKKYDHFYVIINIFMYSTVLFILSDF